jgi:hypothetical protein
LGEGSEEAEKTFMDVGVLDTYTLIGLFISLLSLKAWQDMGLRIVPGADKIEKDFERAQMAIDCIAYLIDRLEPHVSNGEKTRLRNLLADLQINFVQQSSKGSVEG